MSNKFINNFRGELYYTPSDKIIIKQECVSPEDEHFENDCNLDFSIEENCNRMRRSMSFNDIVAVQNNINKRELYDLSEDYNKTKCNSQQDVSRRTFVSMAEAIYHFEKDTPDRFRSIKPKIFTTKTIGHRPTLTIPQSPMLLSKQRSRPHHVLSQKEKEELELNEIRKFKVKANPVPKTVFDGPGHLPEVPKKSVTIPSPFKLTEVQKKVIHSPQQVSNFKARPAPKYLLEKPKIPVKTLKDETKSVVAPKQPVEKFNKPQRHGPVRPEPFSFEKRDEEIKKRQKEKILHQIQDERKLASQFKAQPIPGAIKKRMQSTTASSASTESSDNKENHVKFEARPPTVLYKQPFKPILKPVQLVKPYPFQLSTEKRATEREKFDKEMKEKEEEIKKIMELKENQMLEAEQKAIAEMRAQLVHHPKPVPHLDPFVPEKSVLPITVPETPKFVRRLKKN